MRNSSHRVDLMQMGWHFIESFRVEQNLITLGQHVARIVLMCRLSVLHLCSLVSDCAIVHDH